jgi:hypothetical protein
LCKWEYTNKEYSASHTVATESILLTAVVEAEEGRDIISADFSNTFVQTNMEVNDDANLWATS